MRVGRGRAFAVVALVASIAGCTQAGDASAPRTDGLSGSIVVSAAASLTGAFEKIRSEFVAAHPAVAVSINYGSSGQLARQITEGAPADVAAFADQTPMQQLADAGLLAAPAVVFATNRLAIVTPPGNAAGVRGVADLATVGVVSLCVPTAPCGKFADQVLAAAGVDVPPDMVSRGQDVKAVLTSVTDGDAAAAIVYVTDAMAAGPRVGRVDIPEDANVVAEYPIATLRASSTRTVADAFVSFVLGAAGRRRLAAAGFGSP